MSEAFAACDECGTDASLCRKRIARRDEECCVACIESAGRTHLPPAGGEVSPGITTLDDLAPPAGLVRN